MSAAQIEGQAKRRTLRATDHVGRVAINPDTFAGMVEQFKTDHPDAWNECRTWPTESGLAFIADKLKA